MDGEIDMYAKRFVAMIKTAKADKELYAIVDKVYSDGFEDGCNEGRETDPVCEVDRKDEKDHEGLDEIKAHEEAR